MSKTTPTTNTHEGCENCRGWDAHEKRCRANRKAGPCELERPRWTMEEARAWVGRREVIERYATKCGVHCWHITVLSDSWDGQPDDTMTIWDEAANKSIKLTEDDGPDHGLHRAKLMIDLMIAEGNLPPKPTGRDPREKWA